MLRAIAVRRAPFARSRLALNSSRLTRRTIAMAAAAVQEREAIPVPRSSPGGLPPLSTSSSTSNPSIAARAVSSAHPDRQHPSTDPQTPSVYSFFEKITATWQYIVVDVKSKQTAIIDPVLDYDPASGNISTKTADSLLGFIQEQGLTIAYILCVNIIP